MTFNIWKGNANAVRNVWTITPANPEPGDTFIVEINNKQVSYTLDEDDTYNSTTGWVSAVVAGLVAALQASDIAEFVEIDWSSGTDDDGNATHVVATGPDDGKPVTISASTADSGTFAVSVSTLIEGAAGRNEIQQVNIGSASSGTFTLTFSGQTTAAIAYDANAATVQTALEGLSNIAPGDVTVTGATPLWTVEFKATYAEVNVPIMTGDGSSLDGGTSVSVQVVTEGGAGVNEIQTIDFNSVVDTGTFYLWVWVYSAHLPGQYFAVPLNGISNASEMASTIEEALNAYFFDINVLFSVTETTTSGIYQVEWQGDAERLNQSGFLGWEIALDEQPYSASPLPLYDTGTLVQDGSTAASVEVQRVSIGGGPTGGTFTLTFMGETTAGIAYNASAATVESALEALTPINGVTVTGDAGGPWTITFVDPTGDVETITATATGLTGGAVAISTTQTASSGTNEIELVSLTNSPTGGTFTLTFNAETTGNIAYNASAATVQTALEGLATPVPGDVSVSGSAGGPWTITFTGNYASTDVTALTGDAANLTGGGAQTLTAAETVTATGPNWFTNVDNWSAGTAPADNETLVFEVSDVSCLYGLSSASVTPEKIIARASFTGNIGLPRHNGDYSEYRATELRIGTNGDGANPILTIEVGAGDGTGSQLIRIDTGDKRTKLIVTTTGSASETDSPALNWRGTHSSNEVMVTEGDVGIGAFTGQAATVASLFIGFTDSVESGSSVVVGDQCTVGDVTKSGGELLVQCGMTSLTQDAGTTWIEGSGNVSALKITGGTVYSNTTGVLGRYGTITGITKANPAVVTSVAHGLSTGDIVRVAAVVGMTEVNQREFTVERTGADTFKLVGEDSSGYTAWSSGGTWAKLTTVAVYGRGLLDFSQSLLARQAASAIDVYGDSAEVIDAAKRVTTSSYQTGEFAVRWRGTSRNANLGVDYTEVRK